MAAEMNIIDIPIMSTVEKIQAMEAIWDSLIHEEMEPKSPEWHQNILADRKRKIEEGNAEFISLEELKSKQNR